jgi:hypothetical protein
MLEIADEEDAEKNPLFPARFWSGPRACRQSANFRFVRAFHEWVTGRVYENPPRSASYAFVAETTAGASFGSVSTLATIGAAATDAASD